jgi:hypothetical protein
LPLSFVHCVVRLGSPVLCRADDYLVHRHGVGFDSAPGALAPIRVLLSRFINAYWPHPTHSQAHRDFADSATYTRCLRCAGAPRRPPSGSALSLYIPSEHAALYAPGEIETRFIQFTGFDIGLRLDPMARLPQTSCHPFPAGLVFGVSWFAFLLRPVQLLASLDGSDQDFSQPQRLLHPGFPRVSHPSRGWISLRQFLDGSVDGTFTHWNDSYLRCTRSARAGFLHAVLTADTWRRGAGRDTDEGSWAGEATVQRNQSGASTTSGFSGCDVAGPAASVCSLHAESAGDWRSFRERHDS